MLLSCPHGLALPEPRGFAIADARVSKGAVSWPTYMWKHVHDASMFIMLLLAYKVACSRALSHGASRAAWFRDRRSTGPQGR
eukprot:6353900-Pyramimonas_sp.AAC.1